MNNNNNIDNNNKKKSKKSNFNKVIMNASKEHKFNTSNLNTSRSVYKTEKEYQDSFDEMIAFEKTISKKDKTDINVVIYHEDNNDGLICAYVAWKYLVKENKKKVEFIGLKPSFGQNVNRGISRFFDKMKGKNVLIVDLSYNPQTLSALRNTANSLLVIDDHPDTTKGAKDIFVGENHAACAYVQKFFYPSEKIPKIVQYVDNSDRKLFLPFTPHSNYFTLTLGFRFVHNIFKTRGEKLFEVLDELFKSDNPNFFIFLGKYYDEVRENIKNQIAINARPTNFLGYRVGVLNFNAPSLTKPVGRQIITNFKNRGEHIDFAVLWGYEYTSNAYSITLIDDHKQTKINMADISKKLGQESGTAKGGSGTKHLGHFYWNKDIWSLFNRKSL